MIARFIDMVNAHPLTAGARDLKAPSWKAVAHRISLLDARDVRAAREGERQAAQMYAPVRRQNYQHLRPLECVEIDYANCNNVVIDDTNGLPLGRPTISAGVDRATRVVWGIFIGFEPPSIHTFGQLLRNGLCAKTYLEMQKRAGVWDIKGSYPVHGIPNGLVLDREYANISRSAQEMCREIGINGHVLPRKTPNQKGIVERSFGTVNSQILNVNRGTTFRNVVDKGEYNSVKNAVITLSDLQEIIHLWIDDVYHADVHSGIADIPIRLWNAKTEQFPVNPIDSVDRVDQLTGRLHIAKLSRTGIQHKYLQYISDDLVAELRTPGFRKSCPDGRVKVRYNPGDLCRVFVWMPHLQDYIVAPVNPQWQTYAEGLSLWEHENILAFKRAEVNAVYDPVSLNDAKWKIVEIFESAHARRAKLRSASRYARHKGDSRFAYAGDDVRTSPSRSGKGMQSGRTSSSKSKAPGESPSSWMSPDLAELARTYGIHWSDPKAGPE